MNRILANDLFPSVEAFDLFPAHKKNPLGALKAWISKMRDQPIPEKIALGI